MNKPEKILIIKPSALGDVASVLPVLASLRRSFPDAHISWLVRKEFAGLLEQAEGVDEIILFDRRLLGKWWCSARAFAELKKLAGRLRRGRFDIVFDFQGLFRTGFFAWCTGSKKRFGMAQAREMSTLFYTDKVSAPSSYHVIDYYNKIITEAGAEQIIADAGVRVSEDDMKNTGAMLRENGVQPGGYALFAVGASRSYKCWPVEKFAALADKISSQLDLSIVAIGTSAEKQQLQKLTSLTKTKIIDFTGRTSIAELIALIRQSRVVVSNDTGPGQIAGILGVAIVIIFGLTNPQRLCPYGRPETVAAIDAEVRGPIIESKDKRHSIEAVSVEMVFEKVLAQTH